MALHLHLPHTRGRHRATDEVARLRHQLEGAGCLIAGLRADIAEANAARDAANAKANRVDEAEAEARKAREEADQMRTELVELRAFKANITAVSDLPSVVDTQPIDVQPLRDRFEAGPVVRLGASPLAATDPAHVPSWARDNGEAA